MSAMVTAETKTDAPTFSSDETIGAALARMAQVFAAAGIDSASRDARFLLQSLLGFDGAALLSGSERRLGDAAPRVVDAVRRRLASEPVSRIIGAREFYGRVFVITPDVLDPRPETETVVDLALDVLKSEGLTDKTLSIADIGTGSGILIVTLLAELPNARGIATDISEAALAVARQNAERLGVADRVSFVATRSLEGCTALLDLIVSNPPYIGTVEIAGLEPEVRKYDPPAALDGGPDGLQVYREIANHVASLQHSSRLILEVGAGQAPDVTRIFSSAGGSFLEERKDLGGHVRAVALELHP